MKFSSIAVTAVCLASAEAFTGSVMKQPRFGIQVRCGLWCSQKDPTESN